MGFKKGRSARAAAHEGQNAPTATPSGVRHDGQACVIYQAANGFEYKINVEKMVQVNQSKGTRRAVHYHQGHGKRWAAWYFETARAPGRNYTHSRVTFVQYPQEVCAALSERLRTFRALQAQAQSAGEEVVLADHVQVQRSKEVWVGRLATLEGAFLRRLFSEAPRDEPANQAVAEGCRGQTEEEVQGEEEAECHRGPGHRQEACQLEVQEHLNHLPAQLNGFQASSPNEESSSPGLTVDELAIQACSDEALREALLQVALQHRSGWTAAGAEVANAVRWLLARGLRATPRHCRLAALVHGGLAPLQVLLTEAAVDVRGLELLASEERLAAAELQDESAEAAVAAGGKARAAALARRATAADPTSQSSSGWVQRCKPALKALLARGAILGNPAPTKSKLLKRLEDDGDLLWAQRVLDGIRRNRPDVPEPIVCRIADFAGVVQELQDSDVQLPPSP